MQASRRHASVVVMLVLGGLAVIIAALFGAASWLTRGRAQPNGAVASESDVVAPSVSPSASSSPGTATVAKPWAVNRAPGRATATAGEPSADRKPQAAEAANEESADPQAGTLVQSFSCSGRLPASRSWICTHRSLATQDYNLSLLYRSTLARTRDPQALRKARVAWLAKLDALGAHGSAIAQSYRQWRDQLSAY
jgi:hypothetical protein